MQKRGLGNGLSSTVFGSRISTLLFSMFATIASFYVAGRLWQDAQNRVYLKTELDRISGRGPFALSVKESFKILTCKEQQRKLSALEMELAAARHQGFISKHRPITNGTHSAGRPLLVLGILTGFGGKTNRNAIRRTWMGTGKALQKMEAEKGIIARFVIGRSPNRGDSLDRGIDSEYEQTNDFIILENHEEVGEELTRKAKLFFAHAADLWDAEFYAKANDNVYVNIDALGSTLAAHLDKPRVYIGCMTSGEVISDQDSRWYEPDWWKFGDGKSYFHHASGDLFVISQALAKFISINRSILSTYAHDDISVGSWFIGLDVKHVDEGNFCCSIWLSGALCSHV